MCQDKITLALMHLVDKHGLPNVVDALEDLCNLKARAAQMAPLPADSPVAPNWERAAVILERASNAIVNTTDL